MSNKFIFETISIAYLIKTNLDFRLVYAEQVVIT